MPNRTNNYKVLGAHDLADAPKSFLGDKTPTAYASTIPYTPNPLPQPETIQIKHLRISSETGLPSKVN